MSASERVTPVLTVTRLVLLVGLPEPDLVNRLERELEDVLKDSRRNCVGKRSEEHSKR